MSAVVSLLVSVVALVISAGALYLANRRAQLFVRSALRPTFVNTGLGSADMYVELAVSNVGAKGGLLLWLRIDRIETQGVRIGGTYAGFATGGTLPVETGGVARVPLTLACQVIDSEAIRKADRTSEVDLHVAYRYQRGQRFRPEVEGTIEIPVELDRVLRAVNREAQPD